MPDDGNRYELIDGMLHVSPAPVPRHQVVLGELFFMLRSACPPGLLVVVAPLDVQPDRLTSLQPDVLVTRVADLGPQNLPSTTRAGTGRSRTSRGTRRSRRRGRSR
jgi:hypothetical protein